MRITVHIPDNLGRNIKRLAETKDKLVSSITAEALEYYIKEEKRISLGNKVLEMIGKIDIVPDIKKEIEHGREDCYGRS